MKKLIFSTALMLMAVASHAQSIGVYIYDNDGDFTNIRNDAVFRHKRAVFKYSVFKHDICVFYI